MANTRYLTTIVEDHVRSVLAEHHGVPFEKRRMTLSTGGLHEFDAVAVDGSVVASVKSASGLTSGGNIPSAKIKDYVAELYFLSLVTAPVRLLVLTTPAFHTIFLRSMTGRIAPGVEVVCEPLPVAVQAEVEIVQRLASEEIFPVLDEAEDARP